MKKTSILLLLTCLLGTLEGISQNIWRCNNDPSVTLSPNMFRTLQAAHDAASAGDIIYVEPSYQGTVSYGALTCLKTLKIIGNGYFHTDNTTITQPWVNQGSLVDYINIEAGDGTILNGLSFTAGAAVNIKAQNVTVTRCKIYGQLTLQRNNSSQNPSGAIISHNFFVNEYYVLFNSIGTSTYNSTTCLYTTYQVENITIKNNININFGSMGTISSGGGGLTSCSGLATVTIPGSKNFTFANNVMIDPISQCQNCTVQSNIFLYPDVAGILLNCPGTAASNNVCITSPCVNGTNNVNSVNLATVFVGTVNNGATPDKSYQLTNSSPAKLAGFGGVDAGAFGTTDPYRLSGLAPIPQITSYSKNASSGVYTTSTPMTVTISVRGNN